MMILFKDFTIRLCSKDLLTSIVHPWTKSPFRVEVCSSGEELLKKYQTIKACDYDCSFFIIVDYSMGKDNLDGVETVLALRKNGYKGTIVMRTSDKKEDLILKHPEFDRYLQTNVISYLLDKSDHTGTREVLQYLIRSTK